MPDRRNTAARAVENAALYNVPHIVPARLRATWLADLMTDAVPIGLILQAAGLRSARTLVATRANTRVLFIGWHLCTRLGHETTVRSAHQVLIEALPRDIQWDLGVLRPLTTAATRNDASFNPDAPALVRAGKPRKRIWAGDGVEQVGYDDPYNAANALRRRLDYGHGVAPTLDEHTRATRRGTVEQFIDALIRTTTIDRTGSTYATDDEGATPPEDQSAPLPPAARGRCLDAAWGYKTSKMGELEVGFGFHQHTICRVPDPTAPVDAEPLLIDGFVFTPANSDVVAASLGLIDRIRARQRFTRLVSDLLYTNLLGGRWAVPLAKRGIEQGLNMRRDNHGVVDIDGAQMQHGWLHCPAAPMDQRPLPPDRATAEEWDALHDEVEKFQRTWAFDRKESGLGPDPTSKWICPGARTGPGASRHPTQPARHHPTRRHGAAQVLHELDDRLHPGPRQRLPPAQAHAARVPRQPPAPQARQASRARRGRLRHPQERQPAGREA
ncbi:MAG: hypothetical protein ACYCYA_09515 [Actinomycetes bacterium]